MNFKENSKIEKKIENEFNKLKKDSSTVEEELKDAVSDYEEDNNNSEKNIDNIYDFLEGKC